MKKFKYLDLISLIKEELQIDFYGIHGIEHWKNVFYNTQILSSHYNINSEVFELFSLLHDSKREDEYHDKYHGKRAAAFVEELIQKNIINNLSQQDVDRLQYACANHTYSDKKHPLYSDLIVQICFDSDRLDIGRVGVDVDPYFLSTGYAKKLAVLNDPR
jgi:uncharacterized protein